MDCPVCKDTQLVMTERQNIEIDYCPKCRGVWLDRGELDKIIERSQQDEMERANVAQSLPDTSQQTRPTQQPTSYPPQPQPYGYSETNFGHGGHQSGGHHGRGQGGFLKRLFD